MIPTIEGFNIIKTETGYAVTTLYDLFSYNKPKVLREWPTENEAIAHKERCFEAAIWEYERCIKLGRSFPDND